MNDFLIVILRNIGSFAITMFGVEITIFTVIYSFIVSKRSYHKAVAYNIKCGHDDTHSLLERKFAYEYMKRLKKLNLFVLALAAVSLILYGWSLFIPPVPDEGKDLLGMHVALGWISIVYVIATLVLLCVYVVKYFKEVKL